MENQNPETGQTIPIFEAKNIGQKYGHTQVIVVAWDDQTGTTSVTTWGKDPKQSEQAAKGGNAVKRSFKWPEEECQAKSNRPSLQTEAEFLESLHFTKDPDTGVFSCQIQHGEYDSILVREITGNRFYEIVDSSNHFFLSTRDYNEFCQAIDQINSMTYEEYCATFERQESR